MTTGEMRKDKGVVGNRKESFFSPIFLSIVLIGLTTYWNSFGGVLLFDDDSSIIRNPRIVHLWPVWHLLTDTTRPLVQLSFALNYAWGGLNPLGYHAVNLLIHLAAALTLYGLVWRTAYRKDVAWCAAVLWMVHPLQTQSVTYIVQRAEAMAGLFGLLTLYALARGANAAHAGRCEAGASLQRSRVRCWYMVSVAAACAAIAAKPVAAVIPLLAWLYDRTYWAGSWRAAWQLRRGYYAGLLASLLFAAGLLITASPEYSWAAGFSLAHRSISDYALTQPGVIVHYLRLVIWPHPLVLDYGWPVARHWTEIIPPLVMVGGLGWLIWRAWRTNPKVGFLGIACALLLAPSSSIIPITDLAQEHRMYLPLAPLVVLAMLGLQRFRIAMVATALLVPLYVGLTWRRNDDYRSELAMWHDVVAKRPANWRAHNNLGVALAEQGRLDEAFVHFSEAVRLNPSAPDALHNFRDALALQGDMKQVIQAAE